MHVRLNSNHRGAGKAPRRLVLRGNPAPAGGQAEDESDEGGSGQERARVTETKERETSEKREDTNEFQR